MKTSPLKNSPKNSLFERVFPKRVLFFSPGAFFIYYASVSCSLQLQLCLGYFIYPPASCDTCGKPSLPLPALLSMIIFMVISVYLLAQMAGKRKAPTELSTNPHTVKARSRQTKMTETELVIDKAKKSDVSAVGYAIAKLKKTNEWQEMDEAAQAAAKVECGTNVTLKRSVLPILSSQLYFVLTT